MKLIHRIILGTIFIASLALLFSGSEWLEYKIRVFFGFPLGNLSTWFGLLSLAILTHSDEKDKTGRIASNIVITAACIWLPLGYLISGNVDFNFSGTEWGWQLWVGYSGLVALGSLSVMMWSLLRNWPKKES